MLESFQPGWNAKTNQASGDLRLKLAEISIGEE
jgi:hypothetical protein